MNGNLSKPQFTDHRNAVTKDGAMPINDKYDGPSPLKISNPYNKHAANAHKPLPKPGFF